MKNKTIKQLQEGCGKRTYINYLNTGKLVKCSNLHLCKDCKATLKQTKLIKKVVEEIVDNQTFICEDCNSDEIIGKDEMKKDLMEVFEG